MWTVQDVWTTVGIHPLRPELQPHSWVDHTPPGRRDPAGGPWQPWVCRGDEVAPLARCDPLDLKSTGDVRHTRQVALAGWLLFAAGEHCRSDRLTTGLRNQQPPARPIASTEPCAPCERGRSNMPAPEVCAVGATRPTAWTGVPEIDEQWRACLAPRNVGYPTDRGTAPSTTGVQQCTDRPDRAAPTQKDGKRGGTEDPHQAEGL